MALIPMPERTAPCTPTSCTTSSQPAAPSPQRDTSRVTTRVMSASVVGRETELAELEAVLADASAGRPTIAFLAGESGVGKTRLLSEFERRAAAGDPPARVIGGDCVELGEGELPYAPIVAALRPLARQHDPVLDGLPAATRAELGALIPGLGGAAASTRQLDS